MNNHGIKIIFLWISFILLNTFAGREIYESLNLIGGRTLALAAIASLASLCSFYILKRIEPSRYLLLSILLLIAVLCSSLLELPEERMHVVKFGFLGFLLIASPVSNRTSWVILGIFVSILDEGIQAFLPNRVGDIRDVVINLLSLGWGVLVASLCLKSPQSLGRLFKSSSQNSMDYKTGLN